MQFLDKVLELTRTNWEIIIFVGIMVITIATRLWDLMPRAMHHDESIHAYFSNYYLHTGDYTTTPGFGGGYDPTYHGPFLYTVTALSFFLFGTTEATARLMPAIFGIILVGMTWLLRPFIGRVGVLVAAFLLMISPSITYYSRALRHDIFALTGLFLLFICLLWYMRTHQSRWVYLGAVGLIVAYASHELTFLVAFIFAAFLVIVAFAYNAFSGGARYSNRRYQYDEDVNPVRSAASSLWFSQRWTLIGAVLVFLGIYVLLFSNFLTKPTLIPSGIWNGLSYWFLQHGVARGDQPLFYYLLLMPIYEPLALFAGLGTIIYMLVKWIKGEGDEAISADSVDVVPANRDALVEDEYGNPLPGTPAMRGLTLSFLAFWSIGAFIAFSIAGEKMPWLNMQIALPFTILAAAGIGKLLTSMEWSEVRKGGGAWLGVGVILFIFSAFMLVSALNGTMPRPQGAGADLQNNVRVVLLFLFTLGLLVLCGWLAYKLLPGRAIKVIGVTFILLLVAYGIRSTSLSSFQHSDTPTEMLIYTQSAPDTVIVSDLVKRLSRDETSFDANRSAQDVTGGNDLTIALDQNDAVEWPFDWYFRDMTKLSYFNLENGGDKTVNLAPNTAVIVASEATENEPTFQSFIKDKYTTNKYVLNWWFPEIGTYKNNNNQGDLGMALNWLMSNGMKYILYRDPGLPLGSRNFYLHVRNDLAGKTGLGSVAAGTAPANPTANPTGPIHGMLDLVPTSADRGAFNLPRGMATAPDGSFYVVDTANMRVQKFDKDGKFVSILGDGKGNGSGQFNPFSDSATGTGPGGVAVDKQGNVYVADTWNHRIEKFDNTGKFVTSWGSFINLSDPASSSDSAPNDKFYGPRGVAIGPDGNVYVTDTGNKRVLIFSPTGQYVRQISSNVTPDKATSNYPYNQQGEMNEPVGVAVGSDGSVYVADSLNKRIQKFDNTGKPVAMWPIPTGGWDPGSYLEPFLALDAQGNLYATEPTGAKVVKYSPTGQVLGEKQTSPNNVTLKNPTGITVGSDGQVYVVDTGANGVVKMGTVP
jgi:uncharacterized protein (TIGR03663 family)